MSGHSKWATIKHKKAATDAKRGKSFTRIIKEITIAARNGGDPDGNPRLRTAILAAKAVSHALRQHQEGHHARHRRTGRRQIEEVMFEGYGPGGAAVLVNVATDNRNRTVSDIRHAFSKNGGNMGEQGSVAWMFERKSQIFVPGDKATEDQLMNIVLDAGADDLRNDGDRGRFSPIRRSHESVLKVLEANGIPHRGCHASPWVPKNLIKLEGKNATGMLRLQDALEDHDDVQSVYSNFDIDEKELEALSQ